MTDPWPPPISGTDSTAGRRGSPRIPGELLLQQRSATPVGASHASGASGASGTITGRRRRKPHPARSARILSTGLAATAFFGLVSGYAYAAKSKTSTDDNVVEPNVPTSLPTTNSMIAPAAAGSSVQAPITSRSTNGSSSSGQTTSSPTTQTVAPAPVVVDVPAPATPAPGGGSNSGQPSSGSR